MFDPYEIYRGNAVGLKESAHQISKQSKNFHKFDNFLYLMPGMHPIPCFSTAALKIFSKIFSLRPSNDLFLFLIIEIL